MNKTFLPLLLISTNATLWLAPDSVKLFGILMIIWSFTCLLFTARVFETITATTDDALYQQLLPSRILSAMETQKTKAQTRKSLTLFEPPTMLFLLCICLYALWSLYTALSIQIPGTHGIKTDIESMLGIKYSGLSTMLDTRAHTYIMETEKILLIGFAVWLSGCAAIISNKSQTILAALAALCALNLVLFLLYQNPFTGTLWINGWALLSYGLHIAKPGKKRYHLHQ